MPESFNMSLFPYCKWQKSCVGMRLTFFMLLLPLRMFILTIKYGVSFQFLICNLQFLAIAAVMGSE